MAIRKVSDAGCPCARDDCPCLWVVCPKCGSANAGLIDWRPDDDTTLKCLDCGNRADAEWHHDWAPVAYPDPDADDDAEVNDG